MGRAEIELSTKLSQYKKNSEHLISRELARRANLQMHVAALLRAAAFSPPGARTCVQHRRRHAVAALDVEGRGRRRLEQLEQLMWLDHQLTRWLHRWNQHQHLHQRPHQHHQLRRPAPPTTPLDRRRWWAWRWWRRSWAWAALAFSGAS